MTVRKIKIIDNDEIRNEIDKLYEKQEQGFEYEKLIMKREIKENKVDE